MSKSNLLAACISIVSSVFFLSADAVHAEFSNRHHAIWQQTDGQSVMARENIEYPVEILLEEGMYSFNNTGMKKFHFRRIFRILTQRGVNEWNSVTATWYDWYQEKPVITATVTAPDGSIAKLDPRTLGEVADRQQTENLYTDRRTISGPLPAVTVGSRVEEVYVYSDKKPFFKGGNQEWYSFHRGIPIQKSRIVIEYPSGSYFNYRLLGCTGTPVTGEKNGIKTFTLEIKDLSPIDNPPMFLPSEGEYWRFLAFTTVKSWQDAALEYGKMVDEQMKESSLVGGTVERILKETTDKKDIIKKIVGHLHSLVRYTGVEFGEAAIVPRSPDEVLRRKYGDCKDKSALLVAMLGKAGIKANIALLKAGYELDVDKSIPGIQDFNHAIVYIDSPYNLWIDPTAEFTPVGELPPADLERNALVIKSNSVGLVKTPSKDSGSSRIDLSREVFMSHLGQPVIVEKMNTRGAFSTSYRSWFREAGDKQIREEFITYAKNNFSSGDLMEMNYSKPENMDENFFYSVKVGKCFGAYTDLDEALVEIDQTFIMSKIPEEIIDFKNYTGTEEKDNSPWKNRGVDLVLPVPHIYSFSYLIHTPPGFETVDLPKNSIVSAGPMTIEKKFSAVGNDISAVFTLNTGKGRYTPSEVALLRSSLYDLLKAKYVVIKLASRSSRLMEQGKYGESLTGLDTLIRSYPKEAGYLIRSANVLLSAGFRDAAVQRLNKAVELDPKSIEAQMMLGWANLHDPFGREMRGSFELGKAIDAYDRVVKIDKTVPNAWRNLAILHEYDKDGVRYSRHAQIGKSIEFYDQYRKNIKKDDLNLNYLIALYHNGNYAKLAESRELVDGSSSGWAAYLTGLAIVKGLPGVWNEIDSIATDKKLRFEILENVASNLGFVRQYEMASELIRQISTLSPNTIDLQARSNYLSRMKRWEELTLNETGPESAVYRFMKLIILYEVTDQAISEIFSRQVLDSSDFRESVKSYVQKQKTSVDSNFSGSKSPAATLDEVLSMMKIKTEGDDTIGWRLTASIDLMNSEKNAVFYVIKEGEGYRIIDTADTVPNALGFIALAHCSRGDFKSASRILDWVADLNPGPFGSIYEAHPFFYIYKKGATDKGTLLLSSHVLLSGIGSYTAALREMRKDVSDKSVGIQVDRSILGGLLNQRQFDDALKVIDEMIKNGAKEPLLYMTQLEIFESLGRTETILNTIDGYIAQYPDNSDLVYMKSVILANNGNLTEAKKVISQANEKGIGNADGYNLLAWIGLFTNDKTEDLLNLSMKSNKMTDYTRHHHLHTLATIYAEQGKVTEAKQVIFKILENGGNNDLKEVDMYILGRNAETLGLTSIARDIYAKIKQDEKEKHLSVYELTQKRLKQLEKSKP